MLYVLICIVSLVLQSPVSLNIYNLCQSISLTSPIYFNRNGMWHVVPVQKIDVDAVMRTCIEFNFGQDILEGALVYRIQWRQHTESDKLIQDESKNIQLLVAWNVGHTKGLHLCALLVEHDKELDENKLRKLYQKYWHLLKVQIDPIGSNWLLNNTIVSTTVKVMNGGYRWDVFISEGTKHNVKRPLWMNAER
jgi:hypothetical protein